MARVFADLITNQPTNQPLLSIKQTTEGSCSSCEAIFPPRSPLHQKSGAQRGNRVDCVRVIWTAHIRIIGIFIPFGGWQTFAFGVIEKIVSICILYDNFKSNFCVLPDPGVHLAFYAVTVWTGSGFYPPEAIWRQSWEETKPQLINIDHQNILKNRPTVFEIYGLASGSTWQ